MLCYVYISIGCNNCNYNFSRTDIHYTIVMSPFWHGFVMKLSFLATQQFFTSLPSNPLSLLPQTFPCFLSPLCRICHFLGFTPISVSSSLSALRSATSSFKATVVSLSLSASSPLFLCLALSLYLHLTDRPH